jgi:hypothetical protein
MKGASTSSFVLRDDADCTELPEGQAAFVID